MRAAQVSGRALAFLGDAAWSLLVREHLIEQGYVKGTDLQRYAVTYVNARSQAQAYDVLHEQGYFTQEEEDTFKRGRNDSAGSVPKNTPVSLYRKSTGFEAMLGMLQLEGNTDRIREIWEKVRTLKEKKHVTMDVRKERGETDSHGS